MVCKLVRYRFVMRIFLHLDEVWMNFLGFVGLGTCFFVYMWYNQGIGLFFYNAFFFFFFF